MTTKTNPLRVPKVRAMPDGPRFRASPRAGSRLGLTASIAIALAGCHPDETVRTQRDEEVAFNNCIWNVVGAFNAASIEVVRECRSIAKERSASSNPTPNQPERPNDR